MMNESRLERLAPLSGVISVGLIMIGVVVFNNHDFLPPAEKVANYLNSNPSRVYTGAISPLLRLSP
ncbi:MAG: hypothetical protein WBD62_20115 [Anaerolineales bacterium]|nr:hypothetical protein [Anaerolineales bacterium]